MLKELCLMVDPQELQLVKMNYGILSATPVTKLFLSNLTKISQVKFVRVNILLTETVILDGLQKEFDRQVDLYSFCTFKEIFDSSLSVYEKKFMLLNIIKDELIKNADFLGLFKADLINAFNACVDKNIVYIHNYKDKLFRSPTREYYFSLQTFYDLNKYQIWEVIYDNKKKEIKRRLSYESNMDYYFIISAEWKDNVTFCYKYDNNDESEFCVKTDSILLDEISEPFKNLHTYFEYV